jgi:hypothetical protein
MFRRAAFIIPVVAVAGLLIGVWRHNVGVPIALGALFTIPEMLFLFDSSILRYQGKLARSSLLASMRSAVAWLAAGAVAELAHSFIETALAYLAGLIIVGVAIQPLRLSRIDEAVRSDLKRTWRDISSYNIAAYALNNGDQYLIDLIVGPAGVGVYALGYTLGGGLIALVAEPVSGVLSPRIFRAWSNQDQGPSEAMRIAHHGIMMIATGSALACAAIILANMLGILHWITNSAELAPIAVIIAAASGINAAASLDFIPRLYLEDRAKLMSLIAWITVVIAAGSVVALTILYGVIGAAFGTLIAYVSLAVMQGLSTRRRQPRA